MKCKIRLGRTTSSKYNRKKIHQLVHVISKCTCHKEAAGSRVYWQQSGDAEKPRSTPSVLLPLSPKHTVNWNGMFIHVSGKVTDGLSRITSRGRNWWIGHTEHLVCVSQSCSVHLFFCDALQTHMKHFQHLWDLKYKSHATYLVTDSKSCNNFLIAQLYCSICYQLL